MAFAYRGCLAAHITEIQVRRAWGEDIGLECFQLYPPPLARVRSYASSNDKAIVVDRHIYHKDHPRLIDGQVVLRYHEKSGSRSAERVVGDFACAIADGKITSGTRQCRVKDPLLRIPRGQLMLYFRGKRFGRHSRRHEELPPGHIHSTADGFRRYTPSAQSTLDSDTPKKAARILAQLAEQAPHLRQRRMPLVVLC